MSKFRIEILSVPDREKLVAEIWYKDLLFAEINQENVNVEIEFYSSAKCKFDFEEFLETIKSAKEKLTRFVNP